MSQSERRDRIVEYLRVKPVSHGQVYTFQIAIPESQIEEISAERLAAIKRSFTEQNTNLIPLIVRRTEDYSEEEDYEAVYGADWCLVAKELDIEKLWVWVFDMTDEQAAAAKVEMEQLVGSSVSIATTSGSTEQKSLLEQLETLIAKKLEPMVNQIKVMNLELKKFGYYTMTVAQLKAIAKERQIEGRSKLIRKEHLVTAIMETE